VNIAQLSVLESCNDVILQPVSPVHVPSSQLPSHADLYMLVGRVNEWNYMGDDKTVSLLQCLHDVCNDVMDTLTTFGLFVFIFTSLFLV
jgi:hypothetical protein